MRVRPDDLSSKAVIADPYPAYEQLRDRSPFPYAHLPAGSLSGAEETINAWALMKYADVANALRDHETLSSHQPLAGTLLPRLLLIQDDPPQHTRYRRLVARAFTPKRIAALEPEIESIAHDLVGNMVTGELDVVGALAAPLPLRVIARLLGIPQSAYATFKQWSDASLSVLSMPADQRARSLQAMSRYFQETANEKRLQGADDLITTLVGASIDGDRLAEWEILALCSLLLIAGNETTTNLLGNMLNILARRPELWESIRADRRLVDGVIEEALRFESPVQRLSRIATQDVVISEVLIPRGDVVMIFFGAANRDPAMFSRANEFLPDRASGVHVAFGAGIHRCLGAPLALTESRVALNALLDRFSCIRPSNLPAVRQTAKLFMLGFERLPLVMEA